LNISKDLLFVDNKNRIDVLRKNDYKLQSIFILDKKEQIFTSVVVDEKFFICGGWK
jgi:hypothetical protein